MTPLLLKFGEMDLQRPKHFDDDNWGGLLLEFRRFQRAVKADDLGDAVGSLKTMVESISKTVMELDGQPASNRAFPTIFPAAHASLLDQSIEGQRVEGPSRRILEQSKKMLVALDEIRNQSGSGHGRTFVPNLQTDTVELLASVTFAWILWALPRIEKFAEGRPDVLVRDLIVVNNTFTRGLLVNRLKDANLDALNQGQQREIGAAVARRGMQGTFVVWEDGVEDCAKSDSISAWPVGYREGIFQGLYLNKAGEFHATPASVIASLKVIDPVPDIESVVQEVTDQFEDSIPPNFLQRCSEAGLEKRVERAFDQQISHRNDKEANQLWRLKGALGFPPF